MEAIAKLRDSLVKLAGEERSMCRVAAEQGIFCRGFRLWHDAEFDRRWRGLLGRSNHLSRAQMERLADIWQLAEQVQQRVPLICDAQAAAPGACCGWDEFGNEAIARFCGELLGEEVAVVDDKEKAPRMTGVMGAASARSHPSGHGTAGSD